MPRPRVPVTSVLDVRYVESHFIDLKEMAIRCTTTTGRLREWQERGVFPQPTYFTEDGREWYSPHYATLVRRASARKVSLRALFLREFVDALAGLRKRDPDLYETVVRESKVAQAGDDQVASAFWRAFLSGDYGACLKAPWVACMIRKERLLREIERLLLEPRPDELSWGGRIRRAVDALDRLEQPFADWDRERFGHPVTRDTHITAVRNRFPAVFSRHSAAGPSAIQHSE